MNTPKQISDEDLTNLVDGILYNFEHLNHVKRNKEVLTQLIAHYQATEDIDNLIKDVAVDFFYKWYNASGNNTTQGFNDYWEKNKSRFLPSPPTTEGSE